MGADLGSRGPRPRCTYDNCTNGRLIELTSLSLDVLLSFSLLGLPLSSALLRSFFGSSYLHAQAQFIIGGLRLDFLFESPHSLCSSQHSVSLHGLKTDSLLPLPASSLSSSLSSLFSIYSLFADRSACSPWQWSVCWRWLWSWQRCCQ